MLTGAATLATDPAHAGEDQLSARELEVLGLISDRPLEAAPLDDINRRRRLLCLRAIPAVAGHGYCASRRALLRAKGSTPSSRAAPGTTSMTRMMLIMLIPRCRPAPPRESAYSMSAPTAGPAIAI